MHSALTRAMWGEENSGALTAADANAYIAVASKMAPKRHSVAASLEVILPRPQAVCPWLYPRAVVPYGSMTKGRHPPGFYAPAGAHQGGQTQYHPSTGGYGVGGYGITPPSGCPPTAPFSNRVKQYANWNACYSCEFDVPYSHTSMMCPTNLQKTLQDVYFMLQNAQQYINLGHP